MSRFAARRDRLRRLMRRAGADALLVTNFTNVSYLTGFTGDDSYLLLGAKREWLLTDPRYTTQLADECPGLELIVRAPGMGMLEPIAAAVASAKVRKLGIEADSMTVALHERVRGLGKGMETVAASGLVENLRAIKDADEIADIRFSIKVAERAFAVIRATLREGMTEKMVADELDHQFRLLGGTGASFSSIVAVGPRAALPHARATDAVIGSADFVLIDWGAVARRYCSDLTRILVTGRISPKLERVYGVVLTAQQRAIRAIRPGVSGREVDAVARSVIADSGLGKFGHGLGHGIGLEIHEAPRLSTSSDQPLKAGMVVTVEPGIYLPGWGGVRIEDDVLVTRGGYEVLTSVPRELEQSVVE